MGSKKELTYRFVLWLIIILANQRLAIASCRKSGNHTSHLGKLAAQVIVTPAVLLNHLLLLQRLPHWKRYELILAFLASVFHQSCH